VIIGGIEGAINNQGQSTETTETGETAEGGEVVDENGEVVDETEGDVDETVDETGDGEVLDDGTEVDETGDETVDDSGEVVDDTADETVDEETGVDETEGEVVDENGDVVDETGDVVDEAGAEEEVTVVSILLFDSSPFDVSFQTVTEIVTATNSASKAAKTVTVVSLVFAMYIPCLDTFSRP
jgi:hypothetical protein